MDEQQQTTKEPSELQDRSFTHTAPPTVKTADDKARADADAAEKRADEHPLNFAQRIERLEAAAAKFFGDEHFAIVAPDIFNPDAEREAARLRFQQEMERIEKDAKAKAS